MKCCLQKIVAVLAVLLVIPWFLSRKFRVVRRALIGAPASAIFPLLNDLHRWPRWMEWGRDEPMHYTYEGAPSGVGAVMHWNHRCTNGTMRITQSSLDQRVVYELSMQDGKYRLEGILSLESIGAYTRVTWICKWDSGSNPYAAYLNHWIKRCVGRDLAAGLNRLREVAERTAP